MRGKIKLYHLFSTLNKISIAFVSKIIKFYVFIFKDYFWVKTNWRIKMLYNLSQKGFGFSNTMPECHRQYKHFSILSPCGLTQGRYEVYNTITEEMLRFTTLDVAKGYCEKNI